MKSAEDDWMNGRPLQELLVWFLIVCHLVLVTGCTATRQVSVEGSQIPSLGNAKILRLILKNGEIVQFNKDGGRYVEGSTRDKSYRAIVGLNLESKAVEVDPNLAVDVQIETRSIDVGKTLLLVLWIPAAVAGVYLVVFVISFSSHKGPS